MNCDTDLKNMSMRICKRCYKELYGQGVHTCTPKSSSCCNSPIKIIGDKKEIDPEVDNNFSINRGKTYFYVCKKCNEHCNLVYSTFQNKE